MLKFARQFNTCHLVLVLRPCSSFFLSSLRLFLFSSCSLPLSAQTYHFHYKYSHRELPEAHLAGHKPRIYDILICVKFAFGTHASSLRIFSSSLARSPRALVHCVTCSVWADLLLLLSSLSFSFCVTLNALKALNKRVRDSTGQEAGGEGIFRGVGRPTYMRVPCTFSVIVGGAPVVLVVAPFAN